MMAEQKPVPEGQLPLAPVESPPGGHFQEYGIHVTGSWEALQGKVRAAFGFRLPPDHHWWARFLVDDKEFQVPLEVIKSGETEDGKMVPILPLDEVEALTGSEEEVRSINLKRIGEAAAVLGVAAVTTMFFVQRTKRHRDKKK